MVSPRWMLLVASIAVAVAAVSADDVKTDTASVDYHDRGPYYPKDNHHCPDCVCKPSLSLDPICSCVKKLDFQVLGTANGCIANCVANTPGSFCQNQLCGDTCQNTPNYAFCSFGAKLCYEAECPMNGWINIKASALSCCDGVDDLGVIVYRGQVDDTNEEKNGFDVEFVGACTAGEKFYVCEKVGVINVDSLSVMFGGGYVNECPDGLHSLGCSTSPVASCATTRHGLPGDNKAAKRTNPK